MRRNILSFLASVSLAQTIQAGLWYKTEVVAKIGDLGVESIRSDVSINDQGFVAFFGQLRDTDPGHTLIENIFVGPGSGHSLRNVSQKIRSDSFQRFATGIQINNQGKIITRRGETGPLGTAFHYLEKWDAMIPNQNQVLVTATLGQEFLIIWDYPSMNNDGDVIFMASDGNQNQLVTTDPLNKITLSGELRRPQLSDANTLVLRSGAAPFSVQLRNTAGFASIANYGAAQGFSYLGKSPGISDDGKFMIFFGDLADDTISGADTFGLGTGPGIFVRVDLGGSGKLFRIVGDSRDLGFDSSGTPFGFASFDQDARISIVHHSLGSPGFDEDDVIVSFIATPMSVSPNGLFSNKRGIWTARASIRQVNAVLSIRRTGIMPVAQIDDPIEAAIITDVAIDDSLALIAEDESGFSSRLPRRGEHQVAFWANTSSGPMIIRSTYLDSDEDGLPDHWEQSGATIGGTLVDLPAMGADPFHKDLFVHADWMIPTEALAPNRRALRMIVDAFMRAPVSNPDGQSGIHLHIDAGPNSLLDPIRGTTWGGMSRAGSVPNQRFIGSFDVQGRYIWSDVDMVKQVHFLPAKRAAMFHYLLFADDYDPLEHRSGISRETPGSDFLVTLGDWKPKRGGTIRQEAGTLMHELGHNLGLRHGGGDNLNNKPNFVSIMNYSFQMTGLLTGNGGREWNYSTVTLPSLNENALSEGVGISDPGGHFTLWKAPFTLTGDSYYKLLPYPATDWDCSGTLTSGTIATDINGDGILATLTSFNDWSAVVFDGGGAIGGISATGIGVDYMHTTNNEPSRMNIEAWIPPDLQDDETVSPLDEVTYSPNQGFFPLTVAFDGTASLDPDGQIVNWAWDFGDGSTNSGAVATHTYATPGVYFATLTLTDDDGNKNLTPIQHSIRVFEPFHLRISRVGINSVEIVLLGQSHASYTLEHSSDLRNWSFVTALSTTNGMARLTNRLSASDVRFFRARQQ